MKLGHGTSLAQDASRSPGDEPDGAGFVDYPAINMISL